MDKIVFNKEEIEKTFYNAQKILFDKINIHQIRYKDFDRESFDDLNKELLIAIAGKAIVYCLWVSDNKSAFIQRYIGHAAANISRQRIRAHLTKKNERTGAQLKKIIKALELKHNIGLSFIIIEPAYMRKALEEWLIENNSDTLEWNFVGKSNK
ncbi:MAG: hypothetical protein U0W24_20850 [Bacteroidales bacterium]